MTIRAAVLILGLLVAGQQAWAQPNQRPTQQQVESLISTAIGPLRSCLARSLPGPPTPRVTVSLEFAPEGGFPMPMQIEAPPGSPLERCVGEALAWINAPAIPGDPLRVQCQLPLSNAPRAMCRLVSSTPAPVVPRPVSPPPPPPPIAPPPPVAPPPPITPRPPTGTLSREEVRAVLATLTSAVRQCARASAPPPTIRLHIQLDGQGRAHLIDTTPSPPDQIRACIDQAVGALTFRSTGQRAFTVDYPVSPD